ncbi:16S rRNA (uracil(1498)-N(3))-methyltransferase [Rarobacter faecitabidus]|uniref:Ribosomal RNA small subunit methyltransferase E n=1 Tax=Rarobacter faecitabidus TaxID=13243 RepID=A0A542ZV04_RARFA|nr:16S rRNA (uracil(1498)-N(3))-methyltransferase [Rarobacter faecitabidus]TQL64172.1 16S rRNA (uracil1498-N3)-methyltransferase [Rarobacter faecitabidus]
MSASVFVVTPQVARAARVGGTVPVDGPEGRHAAQVQRLAPGEPIELVDGAGTRITGHVDQTSGKSLTVRVSEVVTEPEPAVRFTLVQALAKGDRDDLAIQTATELGVSGVVPWQARNCVVKWRGERAGKAHAKWREGLISASKQSRRSWHPALGELVVGNALAQRIQQVVADGGVVLVLDADAPRSLADVPKPVAPGAQVWLVVGPEGGIDPSELAEFAAAGAQSAHLGPHVLRTSTAGPAALSALSVVWGLWGRRDRLDA